MTETTCNCGQPTREGRTFCETCADALTKALAEIPWLDDELHTSITKRRGVDYRRGGNGKGGKREHPSPPEWGAVEARDNLKGLLVSWVRLCDDDHVRHSSPHDGFPDDTLPAISRWLMWRVDGLALHEAGGEAVDEITSAVAHCRRVIDARPDKWFAGACDECQVDLYVTAGSRIVACRECKAEYDVDARRQWLLDHARDHHATASEIARAVTMWGDFSATDGKLTDRIRKWGERNRIMVTGHTNVRGTARPMYRVGDVLRLLEEDARIKQARHAG